MTSDSSPDSFRGAALAAPLFALCWLLPNHHLPWADFYPDAWAGIALWLMAAAVLWQSRHAVRPQWPALAMLVLACLGIVWLQYVAGLVPALGVAWVSALYLAGLALALMTGATWERWRPGQCADFLFLAVLIGATGSLLIQLQQWLRIDPGAAFWLFVPAPPRRFFANMGQPNQLASLLWLGVLACAWLRERGRLPGWAAWAWAALLAVGLALAESRTSGLVILLSLLALAFWRRRLDIGRATLVGAVGWAALLAVLTLMLPYANVWLGRSAELQALRGLEDAASRLGFWLQLWEALLQRPWFGYGWMQTSLAQYTADPYAVATGGSLAFAHNLLVDLLIYLGLPLGLTVCALLTIWGVNAVRRVKTREQLWMLLFVAALVVHAMLEFPLHYAYFLLPLGLMVGALNAALGFKPALQTRAWPAAVAMALTMLALVVTLRDYSRIEQDFFSLRFEHQQLDKSEGRTPPDVRVLTQLQDLLWLGRVDPVQAHGEHDVQRALRTTQLLPSVAGQYKLAAMYALAGQPKQAEYWLVVMVRMNALKPATVRALRQQWEEQAEVYAPLLKVSWPEE